MLAKLLVILFIFGTVQKEKDTELMSSTEWREIRTTNVAGYKWSTGETWESARNHEWVIWVDPKIHDHIKWWGQRPDWEADGFMITDAIDQDRVKIQRYWTIIGSFYFYAEK